MASVWSRSTSLDITKQDYDASFAEIKAQRERLTAPPGPGFMAEVMTARLGQDERGMAPAVGQQGQRD